jgi:hypothetical protein
MSMPDDDEKARRLRSEALRKRISDLTRSTTEPAPPPVDESPAEFVQRRTRELNHPPKKSR